MNRRHQVALGLWIASVAMFAAPLARLLVMAAEDTRYSHILLVPFLSLFFLVLRKREILREVRYSPFAGGAVIAAGLWIAVSGFAVAGMLVLWAGIALLCYGPQAVRAAQFPLALLALCIPPPDEFMNQLVDVLQRASADTTAVLLRITGIPFARDGFSFSLSTVIIEVAKECSGVRSFVSMFISSILAGHLLLRGGWTRLGFALLSIPVVIFKNAVRITGITWLGLNVDPGFFTGELHRYSGLPFSLLAVALLVPALWGLRRLERTSKGGALEIDSLGVRDNQVVIHG